MRRTIQGYLLLAGAVLLPGMAAADCDGFKWDVARERAVFATPAAAVTTAASAATTVTAEPGKLYRLTLLPQEQLQLAAEPSKKRIADGAYAGLVRFRVPKAGAYRVSLDQGTWIDVVDGGKTIASDDFNGSPGCKAPRKVVVYTLPAERDLVLQLTGEVEAQVVFSITPVAP